MANSAHLVGTSASRYLVIQFAPSIREAVLMLKGLHSMEGRRRMQFPQLHVVPEHDRSVLTSLG